MSWDTITGISSVVIALCALGFTIWQSRQAQIHNKLSFRPHLTSWSHEDLDSRTYSLELMNNGLGPAFIESFVFKLDGKDISDEGKKAIDKILKTFFPSLNLGTKQAFIAKGYSMAAKEKRTVVEITFPRDAPVTHDEIIDIFKRTVLAITYKSLYDEKFNFTTEEKSNN